MGERRRLLDLVALAGRAAGQEQQPRRVVAQDLGQIARRDLVQIADLVLHVEHRTQLGVVARMARNMDDVETIVFDQGPLQALDTSRVFRCDVNRQVRHDAEDGLLLSFKLQCGVCQVQRRARHEQHA